jgi:FdhE protein
MSSAASATVRVMSPEEIAAQAGGDVPFFQWPAPATVFAERAMRLRQLASGHALQDYLRFMADVAEAQQAVLARLPDMPVPDAAALERAARAGIPPLPATDWPRDPAWRAGLCDLVATLRTKAVPAAAAEVLDRLAVTDETVLERQADALLLGAGAGVDLATAPLVAAALQVYWLLMVADVRAHHRGLGEAFGRIDDATICPCCGSRPTASLVRSGGGLLGQRYLHCSLCGTQWHMARIQCTHCLGTGKIGYASLEAIDGDGDGERAAQAAVQAETCGDCGHYLKIMHAERDPFVDPVADDLASLTLDLLVSESGQRRHGVNPLLLFGEPPPGAP